MVEDAISFWTDIQRYEDMLAADPNSYCFAPLSELYRKLGLLDDAISVAQKGCDLHPDYPGGFFALGNAYHAKGLADQARQALERTVSLNPDNHQALKLLGQLYVEAGELGPARKVLQQVLQQNPDDLESSLLLESLASQMVRPQPEEELLEEVEVIEELTELLDEEDELAAVFEEAEEPEEQEEWAEAAAYQPVQEPAPQTRRDPLTTATLAELYVTQGHLAKALRIYQQLLSEEPGNQGYRSRCAQIRELQLQQEAQQQPATAAQPAAPAAPQPLEPAAARQAAAPKSEAPAQPQGATAFAFEPEGGQAPEGASPLAREEALAHFDLDAALEQPAAPPSGAQGPELTSPPPGDLEAELCSWLENIRRRKDGL